MNIEIPPHLLEKIVDLQAIPIPIADLVDIIGLSFIVGSLFTTFTFVLVEFIKVERRPKEKK